MDTREARRIGGRKAALAWLWMLLLFEGLAFYLELKQEFGIRDFVEMNGDRFFEGLAVLLFVSVIIMGRMAGKWILVDGKNHLLTAMLFWPITTVICLVFVWAVARVEKIYFEDLVKPLLGFVLYVGCIWLIAVRGIKRAGRSSLSP